MKCFILGSSHVTRLNYFMRRNDIKLLNHDIRVQGVNGGMVSSLYRYLLDVQSFRPDVVYLQIGSNDIGDSSKTVENVVFSLQQFIDMLFSMDIKHVIVGLLFNRTWVLPRRGLSVKQYNDRVF